MSIMSEVADRGPQPERGLGSGQPEGGRSRGVVNGMRHGGRGGRVFEGVCRQLD